MKQGSNEPVALSTEELVYVAWLRLLSRFESVGAILQPNCEAWFALKRELLVAFDTVKTMHESASFNPVTLAEALVTARLLLIRLRKFANGKFCSARHGLSGQVFQKTTRDLSDQLGTLAKSIRGVPSLAAA